MTTGERYASKDARTVREGADGKGPQPEAPRRRPTSLCERRWVRFPPPTHPMAESFNATIKKELIHLHTWPTLRKVRNEVFRYIEVYYNRKRPHTGIGYLTPYEMEHKTRQELDEISFQAA
jgi:hypothetical protein